MPTEEDKVLFKNLATLLIELLICIYGESKRQFPQH